MSDTRVYELDVTVRSADGGEATISREYHTNRVSADDAAREFWEAVSDDAKAHMTPVRNGK